jgi:amino acid adenylation domain-containing protein
MADHPFVNRLLQLPEGWAEREAFASSAGQLSFSALREGMLGVCGWLSGRCGVEPGDRVAILLPKGLEAAQIVYGICAAGAVYVPLQLGAPAPRLARILRSTEPKVLITTPEMARRLAADPGFNPGIPVHRLDGTRDGGGIARLLEGAAPGSPAIRDADDLAAIHFTSGSTGEPKGVMLSYGNIAAGIALVLERDGLQAGDRLISHTGLQYAAYDLWFPLAVGCRSFLLSTREATISNSIVEATERERVTVWRATATALRLMLESGELARRNLDCLRLVGAFGEAMPRPLLGRLMEALPRARFSLSYGASEAYCMACFDVPRPLAQNGAPLPAGPVRHECDVSLRDEAGEPVGPGSVGEICVEGPLVMLGYWGDPALTEARRLPGRHRSWRTGDLGYLDEDGLLHLVGRRDHMVKLRGHRFELGEIEAVLRAHPDVRDAVACGLPAADGATEIWAVVLAAPSADPGAGLRRHCAWFLPGFARPSGILRLDEFPMLSSGKVDRQALKALLEDARQRARTKAGEVGAA